MRIVSGEFRGKTLATPAGANTRPTSDRARQAVFNILEHAPWSSGVRDRRVMDLFESTTIASVRHPVAPPMPPPKNPEYNSGEVV